MPRRNMSIVPRHFVKQVVHNVRGANLVMKEIKNAVGAINGAKRTAHPRPFTFAVVWDARVGVLQPRVENQPGIDYEVGASVPEGHRPMAPLAAGVDQTHEGGNLGHGTQYNFETHLGGKHGRVGAKVIHNGATCQWCSVLL